VNPITGTNWEGIGVKPDIPVSSADALSRAHALAIERLMVEAPDPVSRSTFNAVAMKLQSLQEAKSVGTTRLANADILGTYVLEAGPGAAVVILEQEGRLVQRVDGFPDVALTFLNGNRYKPEGFADGFITSFRVKEGKAELLLEVPFGPPTIRAKQ
jgi:hypothetical protein